MLFKTEIKNKKKRKKIIYLLIAFVLLIALSQWFIASAQYTYTPLEDIPGFNYPASGTGAALFEHLIESLYKFGIWTVGVAALLMITIGGFMYMTSAGNTAKAGTAKGIIRDAIYGLIVALFAWLLLFVINPDFTSISLTVPEHQLNTNPNGSSRSTSPVSPGAPNSTSPTRPTQPPTTQPAGNCAQLGSGPCSTSNLSSSCFGSANASRMSSICNVESRGNPSAESGTDRCIGGDAWSVGLFQVNMISSARLLGYRSSDIFEVSGGGDQGSCLRRVTNSNGVSYCAERNCRVINRALYDQVKTRLQDPAYNTQIACQLSNNGSSIRPAWTTTANRCGL